MNSRLALFLNSLAESGRALVEPQPLTEESEDVLGMLIEWEANARRELAFDPPAFHGPAAIWAAQLLYHLCQFTVCRDIGLERILAACRIPCPAPPGPATDWSVDLLLRHLPKLFQFARHLSNADPLVQQLIRIGTTWPLSSVGMPGLDEVQIDPFVHGGPLVLASRKQLSLIEVDYSGIQKVTRTELPSNVVGLIDTAQRGQFATLNRQGQIALYQVEQ